MMNDTEQELKLLKKVAAKTQRFFTPLLSLTDDITKPDVGTGTFVTIYGKRGILTNAHVTNFLKETPANYVSIPNQSMNLIRAPFSLIVFQNDTDIAFIHLTDEVCNVVNQMEKRFWNLNDSAMEWKKNNWHNTKKSLWIIHGAVCQGKKFRYEDSKILEFPKAGPYIVVPDLKDTNRDRRIICPIETANHTPKSFMGMSGGALWQVILSENHEIDQVLLRGIATEFGPAKKAKYLECRGPVTIYQDFYPFCDNLSNKIPSPPYENR
jgi:hypothetical protein